MSDPFDTPERRAMRDTCRKFVEREILPNLSQWERDGEVPRELHRKAAAVGLLGIGFPENIGGCGGQCIDSIVILEALLEAGASVGVIAALFTHNVCLPHMVAVGNPD